MKNLMMLILVCASMALVSCAHYGKKGDCCDKKDAKMSKEECKTKCDKAKKDKAACKTKCDDKKNMKCAKADCKLKPENCTEASCGATTDV